MQIEIVVAAAADGGLRVGVVGAAFLYGMRHGIDLDHLAAISDITGSQTGKARSIFLATVYAVGHALAIVVLGSVAVLAGDRLPRSVDEIMEPVVGASLLVLGSYVLYSLARHGRDFRLRSRWMLLFDGVRKTFRWLERRRHTRRIEIEHAHPAGAPDHDHALLAVARRASTAATTTAVASPKHRHVLALPDDPFPRYGVATAAGVGVIHGVGAETPTQILLLVTAAGVGGGPVGLLLLGVFIFGLLVSNTAVAVGTTLGFASGRRAPAVYLALALITGIASIAMGAFYLTGRTAILSSIFG